MLFYSFIILFVPFHRFWLSFKSKPKKQLDLEVRRSMKLQNMSDKSQKNINYQLQVGKIQTRIEQERKTEKDCTKLMKKAPKDKESEWENKSISGRSNKRNRVIVKN